MAALIICVTVIAYLPALRAGIIWDDSGHITEPALRSLHGLWRIWFEMGATQQYYPVLHSAFWGEHRLWGDAAIGYHAINILLHATAACLLAIILGRLEIPGAWIAALVFALHPVGVESVAWISEQKNTLSTVLYLSAALVYLRFDATRRGRFYLVGTGLFVLALLSKSVTATLPAALLLIFWWRRGRLSWQNDVLPVMPWFMLAAAAGCVTAWVERKFIGAEGAAFNLGFFQRCLLANRVTWFYIGKLFWPANLIFIYPRWEVNPRAAWMYLFPLGTLALAGALFLLRHRTRAPLAALLFFMGSLFPAMGFFDVYPFLFSYVADHFQYLADIGIIALVAAGAALAVRRLSSNTKTIACISLVLPLGALGVLTWRQCRIYVDDETLFRKTVERNPSAWMAHDNLGVALAKHPGRLAEAIAQFEAALKINPDDPVSHNNLGAAFLKYPDRLPGAIAQFEAAVRINPNDAKARSKLGIALAKIPSRLPEAIAQFEAALKINPDDPEAHYNLALTLSKLPDRLADAIVHYRATLAINPDDAEAHNNLGIALMDIPGRLPEAIAQFEAALKINPNYTEAHYNLGVVLADLPGRLPEAVIHYEAALKIDPNDADAHFNTGVALLKLGRNQEAWTHIDAALRLRPDLAPMAARLRSEQSW